ncbi:MAG TPA: imidazolonepropionase [Niabella sp.]|nr:imidazolonepropionase [Niabella sp.]HQW14543.1 imidazolonepropionase [Niabella sp.]HQX19684.1 imidazolonepropionase [Niabella sp.]HQX42550.1 imidazolonepropionase [Niabella sp.]HRB07579.1 imidazolonepropionase [Niabella sp.]
MLIGPIHQLLTMQGLPRRGSLKDEQLPLLNNAGILIKNGLIDDIDDYEVLLKKTENQDPNHHFLNQKFVAVPGFIDVHTHICFAGSRAADFALRNSGKTYLEIAASGGGIRRTVTHTRNASRESLSALTAKNANYLLKQGITTIEVKTGYGLSVEEELKMLYAIRDADAEVAADLVPTCLAAHTIPKEFSENRAGYIQTIAQELLPKIKVENLCRRIDAFIEKSAFTGMELMPYFSKAKELGFEITIHADQFTTGGSQVAVEVGAISADHLEASTDKEIALLANSETVPVVLPGASLGLGMSFAPARKILDAGGSLVIATDFNPGSAPMGQLVAEASILAAYEKLSNAEVLAAITCRAANALGLTDRGVLQKNKIADWVFYDADDYREITYQQGRLQPAQVWKRGARVL